MTQASVGFQCPECLRSGRQKVVTARTLSQQSVPVVTGVLLAVNIAIYVVSTLGTGGSPLVDPSTTFTIDWATLGEGFVRTGSGPELVGVAHGEWYRLVTGGFLHGSLLHIAFNMFALYALGQVIERSLGTVRYVLVYGASLLAGSLGVMLLDPDALTVGASGAVFGLFGFVAVTQYARGMNPMQTGIGGIVVINLLFTFAVPGISVGGHLGGLIGGAVVAAITEFAPSKLRMPPPAVSALVAAFGLACASISIAIA